MKSPRLRIFSTLFLLIAAIILVPLITPLFPFAVLIFVSLFVLCGLWALAQDAWFDALLFLAVGIVIGFSEQLLPDVEPTTRLLSLCGLMAYVGLNLVLLIGPWTRFLPKLVWLYKHRRHLGVTVFLLGLAHASIIFSFYFSYSPTLLLSYTVPFLGFTGLFIMGAMAATSFDKMQKRFHLAQWAVLHTILLVVYATALAAFFTNAGASLEFGHRLFFVAVLVYWVAISPCTLPARLLKFVNGWKQLHLLVYAAYASILIHVWTARVAEEMLYKKIGFFALTTLVIGSHLIGWIFFFIKRKQEQGMTHQTKLIDGKTYDLIGRSEDFVERKGKKVCVNQKDVALYRYEGKVYALSNRCPHQGGPLSEGWIRNGYVECPWHGYQFGLKDGKGPSEFGDAIPSYPVEEIDGHVYVSLETILPEIPSCHGCTNCKCG